MARNRKGECRYCRRPIHTRKAKEHDEDNKPHVYDEWIHTGDNDLFCHGIPERKTARPNEGLDALDISHKHLDAEIVTYYAGDWMPWVCFVHTTEMWRDRMRLVTHVYKGWEKDKLSLEFTEYTY